MMNVIQSFVVLFIHVYFAFPVLPSWELVVSWIWFYDYLNAFACVAIYAGIEIRTTPVGVGNVFLNYFNLSLLFALLLLWNKLNPYCDKVKSETKTKYFCAVIEYDKHLLFSFIVIQCNTTPYQKLTKYNIFVRKIKWALLPIKHLLWFFVDSFPNHSPPPLLITPISRLASRIPKIVPV